jgi:hypothetical protein
MQKDPHAPPLDTSHPASLRAGPDHFATLPASLTDQPPLPVTALATVLLAPVQAFGPSDENTDLVGKTSRPNPLILTRQTLYDLVWSKPMSDLAKEFHMSDVGLAKRCRAVDVPIPYRGYWARRAAGQEPTKLPLPKYRTRTLPSTAEATVPVERVKPIVRDGEEPGVHFGLPSSDSATGLQRPTITPTDAQAWQERIAALEIKPAAAIPDTCAAVRRTAQHKKHPDRRLLQFARGEREGVIVDLQVTDAALNRALLLADRLIRAAGGLGWQLGSPPPPDEPEPHRSRWDPRAPPPKPAPPIARLLVEGEPINFRIEERMREEPRVPTSAELAREKREYFYHAPRAQQVATGALRIVRVEKHYWGPRRKTWYDHRGRLVEMQIPKILASFHDLAVRLRAERLEEERQEQDRRERREAHAKLINDLERQVGAWYRARFLRRYVHAARRSLGRNRIEAKFREHSVDFLDWATAYVDQLDPLSETPRNPDQLPEPDRYYRSDDDELKKTLLRFFGFDGRIPSKLTHQSQTDGQENADEEVEDFEDE